MVAVGDVAGNHRLEIEAVEVPPLIIQLPLQHLAKLMDSHDILACGRAEVKRAVSLQCHREPSISSQIQCYAVLRFGPLSQDESSRKLHCRRGRRHGYGTANAGF